MYLRKFKREKMSTTQVSNEDPSNKDPLQNVFFFTTGQPLTDLKKVVLRYLLMYINMMKIFAECSVDLGTLNCQKCKKNTGLFGAKNVQPITHDCNHFVLVKMLPPFYNNNIYCMHPQLVDDKTYEKLCLVQAVIHFSQTLSCEKDCLMCCWLNKSALPSREICSKILLGKITNKDRCSCKLLTNVWPDKSNHQQNCDFFYPKITSCTGCDNNSCPCADKGYICNCGKPAEFRGVNSDGQAVILCEGHHTPTQNG
jgi:hypothetical protein